MPPADQADWKAYLQRSQALADADAAGARRRKLPPTEWRAQPAPEGGDFKLSAKLGDAWFAGEEAGQLGDNGVVVPDPVGRLVQAHRLQQRARASRACSGPRRTSQASRRITSRRSTIARRPNSFICWLGSGTPPSAKIANRVHQGAELHPGGAVSERRLAAGFSAGGRVPRRHYVQRRRHDACPGVAARDRRRRALLCVS